MHARWTYREKWIRGYSNTQSWPSPEFTGNCRRSYLVGENWAANKDFGLLLDGGAVARCFAEAVLDALALDHT